MVYCLTLRLKWFVEIYSIHCLSASFSEKRDKEYKCMYLHDDLKQLFVIRQQSRKYDQLCVFDLLDNGSCIFTEDVNKYIRSVKFVGNNRWDFHAFKHHSR